MNGSAAVAIISKLPRPGRSKTRLMRTLGVQAALDLHRAFLQDELRQLHQPDRWRLHFVHDAPESDAERDELIDLLAGRAVPVVPGQTSLAHELLGAFKLLLADHGRAVIVSGDVPHLDSTVVADALHALDDADVVLGPGPDGGYYLVGLKVPHDIFTSIPMGTAAVEKATHAAATRLGLRVATVTPLVDMDEAQDLLALDTVSPDVAQRSREVVGGLERHAMSMTLPTDLQVEVTSRCNLRCSACLITHQKLAPDADLTLADWHTIVDDLPHLARVAFQLNGEPLLCRDVFAMIQDAVSRGAHTVMNTNGTLLDERRCQELLQSGLHELRISLDGVRPETVQRMAGADIVEKVKQGIRTMVKLRGERSRPRISLWMVATRLNIAELPELVQLAADLGVEEVYTQRLVLTGHGVATRAHSLHGRDGAVLQEVVARAEAVAATTGVALRASGRQPILASFAVPDDPHPHRGCWRPWRSAVVTASMRVLPCCISTFVEPYADMELGNLRTQTWPEVWNGAPYRRLRSGLLDGPPNPECRDCGKEWSL